jgi:rod shape determining protein RodA
MSVGLAAMFLFHIWENIGMTIGLMPITGIPLPFMSYGGTFQLINLISIGIVLSVGLHREGLSFE